MILLEILRAQAIFMLLLLLTVILPAWAVIRYYRRKADGSASEPDDQGQQPL
ncbi:MAG: hypothetical protein RIC19_24500 [Phaeodactylibacter sp.]|uniref:hypothetical protein n=1 Tax=Phaeodactylibacter sp. TaxID=1940289 RepID=UPI0032EFE6E2